MTTKTDITLLPCPMCGKTDLDHNDYLHTDGVMRVRCAWCHCEAPESAWNRRAAVEADRKRRGEPVGYLVELDGRDTYVSADRTVRDAHLTYGWRPVYAAPQPAEPVKAPSDEHLIETGC
ncbi:hypothetical protein GCM10009125_28080 [Castellaniella daejeonensis]|uniref:Restriction alleviation protein, Lar family n=1 Tax=Castellaniella daejeonensis TaxID=659013 RepID=A0ABP3DPY5_9BURK